MAELGEESERLWTVPELARYLRVPVSTVYKWRTTGEGPRGIRVGRAVALWDTTDPRNPHHLADISDSTGGHVDSLAFSPDGKILAGATDGRLAAWDLSVQSKPSPLGRPFTYRGSVMALAFSADGKTLAAGGDDHLVTLWDFRSPAHWHRIGPALAGHGLAVTALAFSPTGGILASGGDDARVLLWDVTNPARTRRLDRELLGQTDTIMSVAFDGSGSTLASGSADGSVVLWDATDTQRPRQLGATLRNGWSSVNAVALSADGRTLAVGAEHGSGVWDLSAMQAVRRDPLRAACARGGGGLSRAEMGFYAPGLPQRDPCAV